MMPSTSVSADLQQIFSLRAQFSYLFDADELISSPSLVPADLQGKFHEAKFRFLSIRDQLQFRVDQSSVAPRDLLVALHVINRLIHELLLQEKVYLEAVALVQSIVDKVGME